MNDAVICFTRVPKAGKTKTRLMGYLTGEQCAQLHWAFLRDLSDIYARMNADLFVAHTTDTDWELLKPLFPEAQFFVQEGEGLGQRMHHALSKVLSMGYDRCILTGSDLPLLTDTHLRSGFYGLVQADIVLGPTTDGGYYLVGAKEPCPFLFENQTYGCASVFDNAVAAAKAASKTVYTAASCDDVDTPEDLQQLLRVLNSASYTAAYLRKLGETI